MCVITFKINSLNSFEDICFVKSCCLMVLNITIKEKLKEDTAQRWSYFSYTITTPKIHDQSVDVNLI